jgi:hypothetical protein
MRFLKTLIIVALIVIISASPLYGISKPPKPPTPKNICFVVDSKCPIGTLHLTILKFKTMQDINGLPLFKLIGSPAYLSGQVTNVSKGLWVEGYQINFGFWSKDSYRTYSAYDYLKDKLKREPTQAEINAVTEQELKDWFNNKLKIKRPWYLGGGTDWPRDVNVWEQFERKGPCTLLETGYVYDVEGWVEFPSGVVCNIVKIEKKNLASSADGTQVVLKIKQPCAGCSGLDSNY